MNAAREKKIEYIRAQKSPWRIADVCIPLLLAVLAVAIVCTRPRKAGDGVEIVRGDTRVVLSLSQNTEYRVGNALTVVVRGRKVWVKDAKCTHRLCEKTGKISRVGEKIVCAEFGVIVTVTGKSDLAGTVT